MNNTNEILNNLSKEEKEFLLKVIDLAILSVKSGQYPYVSLLVYNGEVVHQSINQSVSNYDPTGHAELKVISEYCSKSKKYFLNNYTLYSNAEPCAMCAGEIYYSVVKNNLWSLKGFYCQLLEYSRKKYNDCRKIIADGKNNPVIIDPCLIESAKVPFEFFANKRLK